MPKANYNDEVPRQLLNNSRYYPMFKDCIGAIDGTHVKASVREHEQAKYIGRKGYATQNIMAACDFNMCFTFAWAGWEGTAHDTRIFLEALRKPEVKFPRPTGVQFIQISIMLLMPGTQIPEAILLHIKEMMFVIIYLIFVEVKQLPNALRKD
uniref:Putative harbinger transposase-derived nuclease domain-containing protein n=1 Tax=Helianthus annuus TaxID=4232 RepID=A0A251UPM0_HELAN